MNTRTKNYIKRMLKHEIFAGTDEMPRVMSQKDFETLTAAGFHIKREIQSRPVIIYSIVDVKHNKDLLTALERGEELGKWSEKNEPTSN